MILITYTPDGQQRMANLADIFKGQTAMLMGAAPTISEQPLHLLEQRGVLSAAMNNVARHFRPTLWVSADHPSCFEPQILYDPGIVKFSPIGHAETLLNDKPFRTVPNIYFFANEPGVAVGELLAERMQTPWYQNTLLVSIVLLNFLGVTRIILGGSDFEFEDRVYAHADGLAEHEREMNRALYTSQKYDIRKLKTVFDKAGIELLDSSVKSKLGGVYRTLGFEEAIALCLENFPKEMVDPRTLPHGTRLAPATFKEHLGIPDLKPGQQYGGMQDIL